LRASVAPGSDGDMDMIRMDMIRMDMIRMEVMRARPSLDTKTLNH
jgi:hypothetical protein